MQIQDLWKVPMCKWSPLTTDQDVCRSCLKTSLSAIFFLINFQHCSAVILLELANHTLIILMTKSTLISQCFNSWITNNYALHMHMQHLLQFYPHSGPHNNNCSLKIRTEIWFDGLACAVRLSTLTLCNHLTAHTRVGVVWNSCTILYVAPTLLTI